MVDFPFFVAKRINRISYIIWQTLFVLADPFDLLINTSSWEEAVGIFNQIGIGYVYDFFKHFNYSLSNFFFLWAFVIELWRVKLNIIFYFKRVFRDVSRWQVYRSHVPVYFLHSVGSARQKIVDVRKIRFKRTWFTLNPVAVEKSSTEATRYTLFIVRMENLLILLAITILQDVFLRITPDHNIAKRFVQTLKSTSHCVIFRSAHYNFPVLTLKVLQIFSRIQTFVNLSNQKAVTIVEFFVDLNWAISFAQINNAVLWKIFLIDAKITRLLLKKTLVRPYINGISFKANFFSSYRCFNPAIRKNIFWHRNLCWISYGLRNTTVNFTRLRTLCS